MDALNEILGKIGSFVWGPLFLIPLLLGTGLYLTIRLRGVQFRKLGSALRLAFIDRKDEGAEGGDISQFQALTTAMAATVGVGNVVGVATAIGIGGPGALFWMWITGLVGMASKYSEAFLAVRFRTKDAAGEISGGPQYYLRRVGGGFGTVLSLVFAVFAVLASFGIGNMTQGNAMATNLTAEFAIPGWITGLATAIFVGVVVIGGIKSIGRVTASLVPIMVIFYMAGALYILAVNVVDIPAAFALIFTDAFTGTAMTGGFVGSTIMVALQMGVARGIFSNESGMGSAAIAAAAAKTTHPVRQGLVSMTQTFIDTIIVVSCTGLVIVTTGTWTMGREHAARMTSAAFAHGLPGTWGSIIVTISIVLFAFSTILGWAYYGERCSERLFGLLGVKVYRIVFTLVAFVGATVPLEVVWNFADIMNGLMALPNLIGLLLLSGLIARETKHYLDNDPKLKAGKAEVDAFMVGHEGAIDSE